MPLSVAISITHDPPCLPTGRLYLSRERTERDHGQLESLRFLVLTVNPTRHEKHSGTESDSSEAANVTVETNPQCINSYTSQPIF